MVCLSSPATPCWDRVGLSDATRQLLFVRPSSAAPSSSGSASVGRSSTSSDVSLDSLDDLCITASLPDTITHKADKRLSSDSTSSNRSAASPLPPVATASTAADTAASGSFSSRHSASPVTIAAVTDMEWSSLPSRLRSPMSLQAVNALLATLPVHSLPSDSGDSDTVMLSVDSLLRVSAGSGSGSSGGASQQSGSGKLLLLILAHLQRVVRRGNGQYAVLH